MQRRLRLGRCGRVDQVAHGFRLNQVELAVEHRAAGELAGRGGPGTRRMKRGQQPGRHLKTAMAGELHQVVSGVAARPGKRDVDAAVDRLPGRRRGRWPALAWRAGARRKPGDDPFGHLERAGPAEPDDGERRPAGRRGQRDDRIGEHGGTMRWGQAFRLAAAGLGSGVRVLTSTIALAVRFFRSRASIHCCGMLAMLLTA